MFPSRNQYRKYKYGRGIAYQTATGMSRIDKMNAMVDRIITEDALILRALAKR